MNPIRMTTRRFIPALALLLAILVVSIGVAQTVEKAPPPLASRTIDETCFEASNAFLVTINFVDLPVGVLSTGIVEHVPDHCSFPSISDDGIIDFDEDTITWGPFATDLDRSVTYYIRPGSSTVNPMEFFGEASYSPVSGPPVTKTIAGDNSVPECGAPTPTPTPSPSPTPQPVGDRSFSKTCYTPDQDLTVTIEFPASPFTGDLYIEETVPENWSASKISDAGVWDSHDRTVTWGPFESAKWDRNVAYGAKPPVGASGKAFFNGRVWTQDGVVVLSEAPIGGDDMIGDCAPSPTPSPTPEYPGGRDAGDFNDDDCSNLDDFLFLLDNWQQDVGGTTMGLDDFLNLLDWWQTGPGC